MKPIKELIRLLVFSNLFVAICAAALTHLSTIILNLSHNTNPILLLVFCSTYFVYNIQRIVRMDYSNLIGKNIGIRLSWVVRNRIILFLTSLGLVGVAIGTLFFVEMPVLILVFPLGIISILYVSPVFYTGRSWISLRKIPFVKVFIISIMWTIVTVVIPFVNEFGFSSFDNSNFQFTLLSRFLFILAITLPFDVRDLIDDCENDLLTIPSIIGIKSTMFISQFLLVGYLLIKVYQYEVMSQLNLNQLIAISITLAITILIISFSTKKRPELYYSGLIEGSMLLLHFGVLVLEY